MKKAAKHQTIYFLKTIVESGQGMANQRVDMANIFKAFLQIVHWRVLIDSSEKWIPRTRKSVCPEQHLCGPGGRHHDLAAARAIKPFLYAPSEITVYGINESEHASRDLDSVEPEQRMAAASDGHCHWAGPGHWHRGGCPPAPGPPWPL